MPALNALHRNGDGRVAVVGICTDGDLESGNATGFVNETHAAYPVVLDPDNALAGRLSVGSLPWCVLLDAAGHVVWQGPEVPPADRLPHAVATTATPPAAAAPLVVHRGSELGTSLAIVVEGADRARIESDIAAAVAEIRRAETVFSIWKPETELSRLNRHAATTAVTCSPELFGVLQYACELAAASDGAFDPTVGALVHAWGFDSDTPAVPAAAARDAARAHVDWRHLELDAARRTAWFRTPGMRVDLGGLAKGYIADVAYRRLRAAGHATVLVNLGGDLRCSARGPGGGPWPVSIENPDDTTRRLCKLAVRDRAVATSGTTARFVREANGRRDHHILDPRTGQPARGCRSVTVLAPDAIVADGLATAVFVLGPTRGLALVERLANVETIIVAADGRVVSSSGIAAATAKAS